MINDNKFSAIQIRVVVIALLLMVLDGFDILSMAFVAQRMAEQLQIGDANLGIIFSVALAGMMIGAMFLAPYSDKYGRRNVLIISVSLISIAMFLTGYVTNFTQLIILRLLTGLGVGAMLANITALTSEFTPPKYTSFCIAIVTAGFPLGATFAGLLIAPVLPIYGWEVVFFALGIATFIMTIIVYLYIPESVQFLSTLKTEEALNKANQLLTKMNKPVLTEFATPEVVYEKTSVTNILGADLFANTIKLWITIFFVFVSMYFLMSWLPKLTINAGFSEANGIHAAVSLNGGGVLGTIVLGWFARKLSLVKLIGLFLAIASFIMFTFSIIADYIHFFILLFLIGFFLQGGFVGLYSLAAKIYPTQVRATGVGWALGLGRFGAVVGPYVGGLMIAQGFTLNHNLLLFAMPLIISALLVCRIYTLPEKM